MLDDRSEGFYFSRIFLVYDDCNIFVGTMSRRNGESDDAQNSRNIP